MLPIMEKESTDAYTINATDIAIIRLLTEDGRLSSSEIAKRIGNISERTVRNRLNALIERSLIRVGALPDPAALGPMVIADVMIQVQPGKVMDVAKRLVEYDAVNYVACITGENDIALQISAPTIVELYKFVSTHIGTLSFVRKTSTTMIPMVLKTFGYKTRDFERLVQTRPTKRATKKESRRFSS